jgi:hypothetical protein
MSPQPHRGSPPAGQGITDARSIEGRIRDLALADVFQLLARGRKTGVLHCEAPLLSRWATLSFRQGTIGQVSVTELGAQPVADGTRWDSVDVEELRERVLDVLCWRDGTFRFTPEPPDVAAGPVRLPVDPLLMEAAQRAIVWDRIEGRVPHARVVPAFSDLEAGALPQLRLTPTMWEVLAHVDGARDLVALASAMRREFAEVAVAVYDLIGEGLLTLREAPVAPRRNPTDVHDLRAADELWIPDRFTAGEIRMPGDQGSDSLFDPVEVGVLTPEGLPAIADDGAEGVAPLAAGPSFRGEQGAAPESIPHHLTEGGRCCREGDARLRDGDLMGAVAWWEAALRAGMPVADAERLREAIALATRLHALVARSAGR